MPLPAAIEKLPSEGERGHIGTTGWSGWLRLGPSCFPVHEIMLQCAKMGPHGFMPMVRFCPQGYCAVQGISGGAQGPLLVRGATGTPRVDTEHT